MSLYTLSETVFTELSNRGLCLSGVDFSVNWFGECYNYWHTAKRRQRITLQGGWRLYLHLRDHGLDDMAAKVHGAMVTEAREPRTMKISTATNLEN